MKCNQCGNEKVVLFTSTICERCDNPASYRAYVPDVDDELTQQDGLGCFLYETDEAAKVVADEFKDMGHNVKIWEAKTSFPISFNEQGESLNVYSVYKEKTLNVGNHDACLVRVMS